MTGNDLLDIVLSKIGTTPVMTLVEAINTTTSTIAQRLLLLKSDIIISSMSETIGSGEKSCMLPRDFQGLAGKPYLVPNRVLEPLGNNIPNDQPGYPAFYRLRGNSLEVSSPPDTEIIIKADYFSQPEEMFSADEDIPFDSVFDEIYIVATVRLLSGMLTVDRAFTAYIEDQLDNVLSCRDRNLPAERGIRFF